MEKEEEKLLSAVWKMEDIAKKKANVYARLLMDMDKASQMEGLAARHQSRIEGLEILLYGKPVKGKRTGAGTR